ncbi:hypothetical protein [Mucilaginibacter lacusdianchii]|uniref:hypothetical protein n=1 Tax=Mucilaginibacter lacusdianchii TaxID=2684211 RepID=UPI00131DB09A|nr:hypothetical protein [Mucilaginibacter sp. JXJ CY 39]
MSSELTQNAIQSFDENFCSYLEYHLTRTFANSSHKAVNRLWCDGIAMPYDSKQLTQQNVHSTQTITTKAWIGLSGQDVYEMTIKLGPTAVERHNQNLSLIDCLPDERSFDWISLDFDTKIIVLELR